MRAALLWRWPTAVTLMLSGSLAMAACGSDASDGAGAAASPDGAPLYGARCAACHGADLRGTAFGPSQLSVVYEPGHHPDASFRSAIRNGVAAHHWDFGPMPMVPGLSDAEIDAIIGFIRGVQQREGFEPYPPG